MSLLFEIERVAELIEDGWWLLLDDGDEICPSCAEEKKEQLLESSQKALDSGHRDGWVVVGCITDDSPDLNCCNCTRRR